MKTVKINNDEYELNSLNESQQLIANHILDLQRKIKSAEFNLDQMRVGYNTFLSLFEQSLIAE